MDPADADDVQAAADGPVAGTVELGDGSTLPVTLDADLVEQARAEGVDVDSLRDAAVPDATIMDLSAQTDGDSATVPVQDRRETDLTSRLRADRDFQFIEDDQIRTLIKNSVNYTERVGHFLLARDDLIPTVKERLKALITGEDGLDVEAADPDSEADQRLADHLEDMYTEDVRPTDVLDAILRENMMNARAVLRSTDLKELDLRELDYLRDGVTGEEIYVQDRATVYEFNVDEPEADDSDAIPGIDLETTTIDPQPLVIGDHVFDISLYDSPPLEAVAETAVNKMVLQRLKARKAEITSFGAVYASVGPPTYLPEDQYFDRVADDDWDGSGQPPTKLERAMTNNLKNAFDTLKEYQSGTVMSVPEFWELEQLEMPETDDALDDQIRGYNRDISRRLLVPLDLIELQSGSELSRETMFATLMTTIAGWRREIKQVFDEFAQVQAEIHDLGDADVEHTFPPLKDADATRIVQALQHAGVAGLTQSEVRTLLNAIQGVDLETETDTGGQVVSPDDDGGQVSPDQPAPAGGPPDPDERVAQMRDMLDDQRRGAGHQDGSQGELSGGADRDAATAQDGDQDAVVFGNVGGDPFGDQDILEAFVDDLLDAGADQVRLGDEVWPDVSGIHDRPVVVSGLSVEAASQVWAEYEGEAYALMGPHQTEAAGDVDVEAILARINGDQSGGGTKNGHRAAGQGGDAGPTPTGHAADVLDAVPFLPDASDASEPVQIGADDLRTWLAWVRGGRPALDAEAAGGFNPTLHPRVPDGQFIERPFDVPDAVLEDLDDLHPSATVDRLVREGELSGNDADALLSDEGVSIDGIPEDATSLGDLADLPDRVDDTPDADGPDSGADDGQTPDWADGAAYTSPDPGQSLRPSDADSVEALYQADEGETGSAAENMQVARWDDGQVAFVKQHRADEAGDRVDGEKPTNAERAIAADAFMRNMGRGDQVPDIAVTDPEGGYMSSRRVDGEHLRGTTPAGADQVDADEYRRFSAAILLAGNSDLHGDNVVVQEDGSFAAVDLNKSGGDFTSDSKFRRRGIRELLRNAEKLGIEMDKKDLEAEAQELAEQLDTEAVLEGVPNSDVTGKARHQFRENMRANIEAFAQGDVSL